MVGLDNKINFFKNWEMNLDKREKQNKEEKEICHKNWRKCKRCTNVSNWKSKRGNRGISNNIAQRYLHFWSHKTNTHR